MADNVETAIYRLQVEGQAKLGELKSHVDGLAASIEKGDGKNRKYSEGLQTTIGKSDAATRAYENMRKALESYEKYAESGKGTQQQLAAYYDITNQKIAVQTKKLEELAAAQANANRIAKSTDYGTQFGPSTGQFQQFAQYKAEDARAFGDQLTARLVPEVKKSAHVSGAVFVDAFEDEMNKLAKIAQLKAEQAGKYFQEDLNKRFGIAETDAYRRGAAGKAGSAFGDVEGEGISKATVHMNQLGNSTKVARYEMINLGRQANDVIVSLASGQGILTVGLQQGSQILDVFTSSERTAGEMFKQMGTAITGFVTNPLTLAVGITAGLVTTTLALANAWDKVNVNAQRAVSGAGARTGTTVSDINAFVEKNTPSITTGAGLSQKESRALAEGLTQTGDIVISKLRSMSDAVMGFSNQTKKSMDESVKAFIKFGEDPRKAMDDLTKVFGPLGDKTRDMVEHYMALGDKTSAYNVLLEATAQKAKAAAENMGLLEKTGRGVTNALQTAIAPTGLESQLEKTRQQLNALLASAEQWAATGQKAPAELVKALELVNREFEKLSARQQDVINTAAGDVFKNIEDKARAATEALIPQIEQIKKLEEELVKLRAAEAQGSGGAENTAAINAAEVALQKTRQVKEETARANQYTLAIAASWGNVSQAVAMVLHELQQQLSLAQAVTGQQQMAAQAAIDYANALREGKSELEATAIAAAKLEVSQAQATTSVKQQIEALKDSTRMIEAQANGTQAATAAAIAYKNAIASGADSTAAAALSAATLANELAKAGQFAQQIPDALGQFNLSGGTLASALAGQGQQWIPAGQQDMSHSAFEPSIMTQSGGFVVDALMGPTRGIGSPAGMYNNLVRQWAEEADPGSAGDIANKVLQGGGTVDSAIAALIRHGNTATTEDLFMGGNLISAGRAGVDVTSTLQSLYDLKNAGADKGTQIANNQQMLTWLQGQPQTVENMRAISSLTDEIRSLAESTDTLNGTNTRTNELLSPYYTQDPRTSHIGFRSQGMANGGYVDVPGGASANDNMLAMIPVASGERIYVDPMTNRRGTGSGGMTINISSPITINGNANVDQLGRTLYQSNQALAKQVRTATQ